MNTVTCTALKPFFWDGKNVEAGDTVQMSAHNAKWMVTRKAVVEKSATAEKPAAKVSKEKATEKKSK